MRSNGTAYYFYKNLQGDVIAITDDTGATVARYTYDALGKCTEKLLNISGSNNYNYARNNPLRYRGYIYDTETGFYYLQSRYYDPEIGRFINADDVMFIGATGTVLSTNLFTYCENNAVNNSDSTGYLTGVFELPIAAKIILKLSSILPKLIGSLTASLSSIKTALASIAIPFLMITAPTVAIVGVVYAVNLVKKEYYDAVKLKEYCDKLAKNKRQSDDHGDGYCVYIIAEQVGDRVVYVGRTDCFERRKCEHLSGRTKHKFSYAKHKMLLVKDNLTYRESRALEQAIITAYGIGELKNMINSISKKNIGNFKEEFKRFNGLIECYFDD